MQALPKPEGELFFGIVPLVLAVVAFVAQWRSRPATNPGDASAPPVSRIRRNVTRVLVIVIAAAAGGTGPHRVDRRLRQLRRRHSGARVECHAHCHQRRNRVCGIADCFRRAHDSERLPGCRSTPALATLLTLFAVWMSLGPVPHTRGQLLQVPALYALLLRTRPRLRGPPRPGSIRDGGGVFSSMLARSGAPRSSCEPCAARLARHWSRSRARLPRRSGICADARQPSGAATDVMPPSASKPPPMRRPCITPSRRMPDARVIDRVPLWRSCLGASLRLLLDRALEATGEWLQRDVSRQLQNACRLVRAASLHPDQAWQALRATGTTHVIVHEGALSAGEAAPSRHGSPITSPSRSRGSSGRALRRGRDFRALTHPAECLSRSSRFSFTAFTTRCPSGSSGMIPLNAR